MVELGYKANLSDINAVLLLGQLPRLEAQLARREAIARRYEEAFAGIDGLELSDRAGRHAERPAPLHHLGSAPAPRRVAVDAAGQAGSAWL